MFVLAEGEISAVGRRCRNGFPDSTQWLSDHAWTSSKLSEETRFLSHHIHTIRHPLASLVPFPTLGFGFPEACLEVKDGQMDRVEISFGDSEFVLRLRLDAVP